MTTSLPLHLRELAQRAAVLHLSLQGLRASYATDAEAQADFDAVCQDAAKLRTHLGCVLIAVEYAKGGSNT